MSILNRNNTRRNGIYGATDPILRAALLAGLEGCFKSACGGYLFGTGKKNTYICKFVKKIEDPVEDLMKAAELLNAVALVCSLDAPKVLFFDASSKKRVKSMP